MLWVDRLFVTSADLATVDSEVANVAAVEQINLDGPTGLIRRSIDDSGRYLMSKFVSYGYPVSSDVSWEHNFAVSYTGGEATRARYVVDNVVVSGPDGVGFSDVTAWVVQRVLADFFYAASNRRTDEDRYEKKAKNYRHAAQWVYWQHLLRAGVPCVNQPLVAPAAAMAYNPGTFAASTTNGPGTAEDTFDVAISYVYSGKASNNESHPSEPQTVELVSGQVVEVDISDLRPPASPTTSAPVLNARSVRTGLVPDAWNVYAGRVGEVLYRQNSSPIPISTLTYTFLADPALDGQIARLGQAPDLYATIGNPVPRG